MKPCILHIETSTRSCSIAVSYGLDCIGAAEDHQGEHTAVINSLIRSTLNQAGRELKNLDAIAVNEGPGSYTALRIGVVSAKALSFTLEKPLILVSGFDMIVNEAKFIFPDASNYIAMLDAGRDEVYMAIFDKALNRISEPRAEKLHNNMSWRSKIDSEACVIAGSGCKKWKEFVDNWSPQMIEISWSSRLMIPLAAERFNRREFTDPGPARPFYLKLPHITIPKEKLITR